MMNANTTLSFDDNITLSFPNVTDIPATANLSYCNLTTFAKNYREVHGHLSILVCVFGSIANILNICVLTTREMRWPTNFILTGLAVADLLVMLEYIPFASHVYLDPNSRKVQSYFTYGWALFMMFHAFFSQVFHFISCCLTVILAIWRYIAITHPQNKLWNIVSNRGNTLWAIFIAYIFCPLVCLPLYLSLDVKEETKLLFENNTIILNKDADKYRNISHNGTIFLVSPNGILKDVSVLVYGLLIKLVPCILLTILSKQLISALLETKSRRRKLLNSSGLPLVEGNDNKGSMKQRHLEKEQQTDRTTRMLLAVLLLFLITEFPQALLALIGMLIREDAFFNQCYVPLGDLMDILALTNSAINFILYCSMSRQFRSAFREVFRPKFLNRWIPVAQQPPEMNGGITQVTQV